MQPEAIHELRRALDWAREDGPGTAFVVTNHFDDTCVVLEACGLEIEGHDAHRGERVVRLVGPTFGRPLTSFVGRIDAAFYLEQPGERVAAEIARRIEPSRAA